MTKTLTRSLRRWQSRPVLHATDGTTGVPDATRRYLRPPGTYPVAIGAGIGALVALPYGAELARCLRTAR
jgi:hypothetical protein